MSSILHSQSLSLPGYRNIGAIFRSERTLVHSAVRVEGNVKVALKSVMPGSSDANARWRLMHEYKLLSDLDIPGVVKAHGLKHTELGITLELQHVGSSNLHLLAGEVLSIQRVLEIGLQMSRVITALHDNDVSHRDINPSNVMYHRTSGQLWLIDFGLATNLARESAEALPSGRLEGTLGYLSPEQTGRMNRSVDRRTDFYGLGATLYQLLTNRPPFAIRDPMALLHATVALQPTHVCTVRADVPRVLGDIVMRLLHKDAEQRYQSGAALVDDLGECVRRLDGDGTIAPFELGRTDRRGKFLIPEKLYGRDEALSTIRRALDRCLAGANSVVALPGKTGVGKTALSRELLPQLKGSGLLAIGVCDPVRRSPYGPILQVFRAVTAAVMEGSPEDLMRHRERYDAAVEGHGSMLSLLMPELSAIVGPLDPVPELPPSEVRERVLRMLVRLLYAYHAPEHPLVVFLDDLQWSDPGTLEVLDRLLSSEQTGGPLLVLAWRSDEVPATHPLADLLARSGDAIEQIQLGALSREDIAELLGDALSQPAAEVDELAVRVHEKTGGNAFFVRQFLSSLAVEGLLEFDGDSGAWCWSLDAIDALPPTHNVGQLLSRRLEALTPVARTVLGMAACVGKRFELSSLDDIADLSREDLQEGLVESIGAGLIQSRSEAWTELQGWTAPLEPGAKAAVKGEFWFVHDAVYDAAIGLPGTQKRQAYHLSAGRRLLEEWRTGKADPFIVADQFIQALPLLVDPVETLDVARVNLDAGERAYGSAAFETALDYLEKGCSLIRESDWTDAYDLALRLHILAAETQLMCPNSQASIDFATVAVDHARDVIDRVAVQRIRIRYHTARYEFDETIRMSLETLRSVGVHLPARPHPGHVAWALARTYLRVRGMNLEKLRKIPDNTDKKVEAAMGLLVDSAAPSYYISSNLMPLILCKLVELSVRHGMSRASSFGMAGFAFIEIMVRDDVKTAMMWATFARELVVRLDAKALSPRVELVALGLVESRARPLAELIQPFRKSAWDAKEVGDPEYTALCHFNSAFLTYLSGAPLPQAQEQCREDLAVCEELAQVQPINAVLLTLQVLECLSGGAPDPAIMSGTYMDYDTMVEKLRESGDKASLYSAVARQAFLTLLFAEDTELLIAQMTEALSYVSHSPGSPETGGVLFHSALAWIRHMRESGRPSGTPWRRAKKHLKTLRKWAVDGPENSAHKARLIEAELADLQGKRTEAMGLYEEAIALARGSGMLHEEALCLEWFARASLRYGYHRNAAMLIREAKATWSAYGCEPRLAVMATLEDELSQAGGKVPLSVATMSSGSLSMSRSRSLDMGSVFKASQAVSGEIELRALLERLMRVIIESAGATSGFLVLNGPPQRVVAFASTGEGEDVTVEVLSPEDQTSPGTFYPDAQSVVNFVTNAVEPLVLHDVPADSRFFSGSDAAPCSLLCVPATKGQELVAVMYLENTLTRHAFSEDRYEVVTVLCSQAAVSIENAVLYEDLQDALGTQTALTEAYGRFMPPQFLSLVGRDSILDLGLGDQVLRPITVMFADIRNFTGLAEAIGPAHTFAFINRYLGHMEPAIHAHKGFVNQYLGDGIMALFPSSADDAVLGALAMIDALRVLNAELNEAGEMPVDIGIGLNSGPLMVGAIGGLDRMGRGIVGDATNVASRVEGMTKRYQVPLLIGESTFSALTDARVTTRLVDRVMPKGREQEMSVYEVLEAAEPEVRQAKIDSLQDYQRGVAHWSEGRFAEAEVYFNACADAFPADTPAMLFAARCKLQASS